MKKKKGDISIVFCGHGSRDPRFKSDFKRFVNSTKLFFLDSKVYICFIEKNYPSIEDLLKKIIKNHKIIIFVPCLLFRGNHFNIDVKKKIYFINKNIKITENIDIKKNLLNVYSKILEKKIQKKKTNILVNIASYSSNQNIIKDLKSYSKELSNKLSINKYYFCLYGDDEGVLEELSSFCENETNIIVHPIFLFDGYLYNKIISKFKKSFTNFHYTQPISHEKKIQTIFRKLINSKLQAFE